MPNILLTRIDNRLVHGQVGVTWTKTLGANLIVVADDTAAEDRIQQEKRNIGIIRLKNMFLVFLPPLPKGFQKVPILLRLKGQVPFTDLFDRHMQA